MKASTIELCVKHAMEDYYDANGRNGVNTERLKSYINGCGGNHEDFVNGMLMVMESVYGKSEYDIRMRT